MIREYVFEVNGFETKASYHDEAVEMIFVPLLKKWKEMQEKLGRRLLVMVSAPPGAGKSTICQFLEYLGKKEGICEIQSLGLDGFHYHQDYILSHYVLIDGEEVPMKQVKGSPESYDTDWLQKKIGQLWEGDPTFPVYSRILHDVVEDAVTVTSDIVLLEGNWFLLSEEPWMTLAKRCDDSLFIYAREELLRERLIQRKEKGGLSREEAEAYYENSDKKNVRRLLEHHQAGGTNLRITSDGNYEICG